MSIETSIETLKGIFSNEPEALKIFNIENLKPEYLKRKFRNDNELFASPINLYVTGRTGAGKTALGNCLLSENSVMKSDGFQDCTREIGLFRLASNLHFFDLPGIASGVEPENINRVALLMPQLEDEFADPPAVPLSQSDLLKILDFTGCTKSKDSAAEGTVTVAQWQSEAMQTDIGPDVIVYVLAPNKHFLREDRKYLGELLKIWKERKKCCTVITVLNIFEKDGNILPTSQELEYARSEVPKVYHAVYKNESVPPVVEINSLTGEGIGELAEIVCKILPAEKIGNMQMVLRDELKEYAEQERVKRYYRTLGLIAGRLARYTVDKKIHGQNLFQIAASAVTAYGVMTFKNVEAFAEIKASMDSIAEQVDRVERSQQNEITKKENVMGKKEITRVVPKTEEFIVKDTVHKPVTKKEKIIETLFVQEAEKITRTEETYVPVEKTRLVSHGGLGIKDWLFGKKEENYIEHEKKSIQKDDIVMVSKPRNVERYETTTDWVAETKERTEIRVVGYEEEVIGTVEVVVAQVDKVVGTEFLKGGYPAIELLLKIGLSVQHYCNSQNDSLDWAASMQQGELLAERKLNSARPKIEQLINEPDGEIELVKLLEGVLAS